MNADQAWQAALDQLQVDMSRAAFNTWVKDAYLVEYQDGQFIIGAMSEYGRDWLDCRLKSTIARTLTGMMNRPVTVEFIVLDGHAAPEETAESSAGESEEEVEDDEQVENDPDEEHLVFFDAPRSVYNAIVRPEKILSLPRYLLRFLPLVGSEIFLVQWAFRQMRYLRTDPGKQHLSFEATINDLLRWTTWASRASFRRYMDRPELKWFGIEQIPQEGRAIDPVTGLARQKPNRYRIQVDLPLTPMDADNLRVILADLCIREDPVDALRQTLKMSDAILRPENPLPMPTIAHQAMPPKPILVGDVVKGMLENIKLELGTRKELTRLSDQLANKILRPTESIQATWYFFQDWMAELERAELGTFLILMRSLCFCSSAETRDSVWIEGGDWEISEWMGIKREKTISSWFPKAYATGPRRKTQETLVEHSRKEQERAAHDAACIEQFVRRDGQRPNNQGRHAYHFHVRVGSEPLTPTDRVLYDVAMDVTLGCEKGNALDLLGEWVTAARFSIEIENSAFETLDEVKIPLLRLSENGNSAFEPLVPAKIPPLRPSEERKSAFGTLEHILNSAFETLEASKIPPLKLFKALKDSSTSTKSST